MTHAGPSAQSLPFGAGHHGRFGIRFEKMAVRFESRPFPPNTPTVEGSDGEQLMSQGHGMFWLFSPGASVAHCP